MKAVVSVPARVLAPKASAMTFEQAAAVPQAGGLALQGLRDKGKLHPRHRVLINGAGGGVGTFAVQIAKSSGADVTGVDHTSKLAALRSLGADHVIDYTLQDFTENGQRYDVILDVTATRSVAAYRRALNPHGTCVVIGGSMRALGKVFLLGRVRMTEQRSAGVLLYKPKTDDLISMNELFESGKVVPVIDRQYPLREAPEAMRVFGQGHVVGKLVITVADRDTG